MFRLSRRIPSQRMLESIPAHLRLEALEDRNLLNATVGSLALQNDVYSQSQIIVKLTSSAPASHYGLSGIGSDLYTAQVASGVSVAQAITYYEGLAGVEYATPDYQVSLQRTPNDPSYGSLYGLNNTGQSGGTADADIDAPEAWDLSTGSGNTVVAVIDTGVDYNHPDLAANMWHNPGEINNDGIDNDGNGFVDDYYGYNFLANNGNPMDDNNHGTHVAGTIGAVGDNGVGVVGVNWHVKIMALKFLGANGSGSLSDAVRALNYAVMMGVKISNNSYGGGGFYQPMADAIDAARKAGHIFVAAAGNSGVNTDTNPAYPAGYNYDNVISVAATDRNDNLASFSNYGAASVDLAAPGVAILSTTRNNTYSTFSGTSMASPHVAGAVALVWDANPTLTYSQVIARILQNTDAKASLTGKVATGGRLNVDKALRAGNPPVDASGPRVTGVTFSGPSSLNLNSARITFSEAINPASLTAADLVLTRPGGATVAITGISAVSGSGNTQFNITFASQTTPGTYTLVIGPDIRDTAGNQMDQNQNGVNGETTDKFTATRGIPQVNTFTNSTVVNIPDMATVTSSIVVNQDITISDINVRVNITHTYDSDLILTLIAPNGNRYTLVNRRGGSGDNFTNTTLDDQGATSITAAAAPFTGTFRPETSLAGLNGGNARGTWKLEIRDAAAQDVGKLTNWSLIVSSNPGGLGGQSVGGDEGDLGSAPEAGTIADKQLDVVTPSAKLADPFSPFASISSAGTRSVFTAVSEMLGRYTSQAETPIRVVESTSTEEEETLSLTPVSDFFASSDEDDTLPETESSDESEVALFGVELLA